MRTRIVIGIALVTIVVGAIAAGISLTSGGNSPARESAAGGPSSPIDKPPPPTQEQQTAAVDDTGATQTAFVDRWIPHSVDELMKVATAVVVGTVARAGEPELKPVGGAPAGMKKRERQYSVQVEHVLKGDVPSTIQVAQVLSIITVAESNFPDVLPLIVGDRYVLFLRPGLPKEVWVPFEEPYRYHLSDGAAIPELGSEATAALGDQLSDAFPPMAEEALLSRLEDVASAFPEAVPLAALRTSSAPSVELPEPGDRVNLTESLGLSVPTALDIEAGFTFKWGSSRGGRVDDLELLQQLAVALDVSVVWEAPEERAPIGAFPTVIFRLTEPVLGIPTVGFEYDSSEGALIRREGMIRIPAAAKALLDDALGVE